MKVLFLAYSYPPGNVPATPRTWNLTRVMTGLGCEVDVLTIPASAWRHRSGEDAPSLRGARRIDVPPRWAFLQPSHLVTGRNAMTRFAGGVARKLSRHLGLDPAAGWVREVEKITAKLTPDDVDVILATGSPFSSFEIARRLSRRIGRPYVIDYRDLWHHNPHGGQIAREQSERDVVRDAAAVIAVSPSLLRVLDGAYGVGARGHVLPNGFDEDEMRAVKPMHFDHFAIVYAGQFYPPKRVAAPLLEGLRRIAPKVPWKFHYLGPNPDEVLGPAKELGIEDRVVNHGQRSRAESLAAVAGSSLAVVITTVQREASDADRGIVTSKIFDIVGLRRPLLTICPPGSDVEAMLHGREATAFIPGDEPDAIAAFVEKLAASPHLPPPADDFSWQRRGPHVQEILDQAVGR